MKKNRLDAFIRQNREEPDRAKKDAFLRNLGGEAPDLAPAPIIAAPRRMRPALRICAAVCAAIALTVGICAVTILRGGTFIPGIGVVNADTAGTVLASEGSVTVGGITFERLVMVDDGDGCTLVSWTFPQSYDPSKNTEFYDREYYRYVQGMESKIYVDTENGSYLFQMHTGGYDNYTLFRLSGYDGCDVITLTVDGDMADVKLYPMTDEAASRTGTAANGLFRVSAIAIPGTNRLLAERYEIDSGFAALLPEISAAAVRIDAGLHGESAVDAAGNVLDPRGRTGEDFTVEDEDGNVKQFGSGMYVANYENDGDQPIAAVCYDAGEANIVFEKDAFDSITVAIPDEGETEDLGGILAFDMDGIRVYLDRAEIKKIEHKKYLWISGHAEIANADAAEKITALYPRFHAEKSAAEKSAAENPHVSEMGVSADHLTFALHFNLYYLKDTGAVTLRLRELCAVFAFDQPLTTALTDNTAL